MSRLPQLMMTALELLFLQAGLFLDLFIIIIIFMYCLHSKYLTFLTRRRTCQHS